MVDAAKTKGNSAQKRNFDIIVIGAGLVGASAAVSLSRQGFSVALMDKSIPDYDVSPLYLPDDWDSRIYALSPGNIEWLERMGVWPLLDQSRVCPIERMEVFGDEDAEPLVFDAYQANALNLGVILENRLLLQALWFKIKELDVHVVTSAEIMSLTVAEDCASISTANGDVFNAKLVIGADGGNSWVRRQSQIPVQMHDYEQMGIVANFEAELPHGNVARQWFTEDGVLAWLPLPGNRISIVWSTDKSGELLKLTLEQLTDTVALTGQHALGALRLISDTSAFKLVKQSAHMLVSARVALVGDAAHQIHPLAGQGVNLGFRDVIALGSVLQNGSTQQDIGDLFVLRKYERARKADIAALGGVTHGLHWLFQSQRPIMKTLRNFGLRLTNQQSALKGRLIKQAII